MISKSKIEELIVTAALAPCQSIQSACKKIETIYMPSHKMIKGKHIVGNSIVEDAVERVHEKITSNPFG